MAGTSWCWMLVAVVMLGVGLALGGCVPGEPWMDKMVPPVGDGVSRAAMPDVDELRWDRRVVLIFAPTPDDPRLAEQGGLAAAARDRWSRTDLSGELADRRLLVATVLPEAGSAVSFDRASPDPQQATAWTIDTAAAASLRERFGVGDLDFAVLLIGLDGGEKLRSDVPVDVEALFARIDAMPMRQAELRRRAARGPGDVADRGDTGD